MKTILTALLASVASLAPLWAAERGLRQFPHEFRGNWAIDETCITWLSVDERRANHTEIGACSLNGLSKLSHGHKMSLTCGGHEPGDKHRTTEIWSAKQYGSEKFLSIYYPQLGIITYKQCN